MLHLATPPLSNIALQTDMHCPAPVSKSSRGIYLKPILLAVLTTVFAAVATSFLFFSIANILFANTAKAGEQPARFQQKAKGKFVKARQQADFVFTGTWPDVKNTGKK